MTTDHVITVCVTSDFLCARCLSGAEHVPNSFRRRKQYAAKQSPPSCRHYGIANVVTLASTFYRENGITSVV